MVAENATNTNTQRNLEIFREKGNARNGAATTKKKPPAAATTSRRCEKSPVANIQRLSAPMMAKPVPTSAMKIFVRLRDCILGT